MAIIFTETINAAACGNIQACAAEAVASLAMHFEVSEGAAPGGSEQQVSLPASAPSELRVAFESASSPTEPDVVSWVAGNWTLRMNVTTGNMDIILNAVYVCRVNSSCASPVSVGSSTGLSEQMTAGVKTHVISGSLVSGPVTDRVYIVYAFENLNSMFARTLGVTPDQNIDSPIIGPVTTSPVIPIFVGQWVGDAVKPIEAAPQYFPLILPPPPPLPPANAVIPYAIGQWLGEDVKPIEAKPFFYEYKRLEPAKPVIAYTIVRDYGARPQELEVVPKYFATLGAEFAPPAPANPVIEFVVVRDFGERVEPMIGTEPRYFEFPYLAADLFPTYPVIAYTIGQWLGDEVLAIEVEPKYYPLIMPEAPSAPGVHLPQFIRQVLESSLWDKRDVWTPASAPQYYGGPELVPFVVSYSQYRARVRVNTFLYGRVDFIFEVDVHDGRVRIFNETDGVVLPDSYLQNWGTAYTAQPLSVKVKLAKGNKLYRVEQGSTSGRTVAVDNARLYPETRTGA